MSTISDLSDCHDWFRGRTALVTGASSGMGAAIALALGRSGTRVGVNYRGNCDGAETVKRRQHRMRFNPHSAKDFCCEHGLHDLSSTARSSAVAPMGLWRDKRDEILCRIRVKSTTTPTGRGFSRPNEKRFILEFCGSEYPITNSQ